MKLKCPYCGKLIEECGLQDHQTYNKKCWFKQYESLLAGPGSTMTVRCLCGCGRIKEIRKADFKRGWGMFYSKACKARWQEARTGQFRAYMHGYGKSYAAYRKGQTGNGIPVPSNHAGIIDQEYDEICMEMELGWDAHKDFL